MATEYEQVKVTFVRIGLSSTLGIALRMSAAESGPPIIARIAPDSAAAKSSKVRCGDMLAAVNGVGTGGMELQKVEHMLRAPAVCLTLMRARGDADEAANPGGRSATGRTARLRKAVVAPLLTEMVSLPTVGARRHDSVGSEPRPGGRTDMVGLRSAFIDFAQPGNGAERVRKGDLAVLLRVMGKAPSAADWGACPLALGNTLTWDDFSPWYESMPHADGHGGRAQAQASMRQLAEMRLAFKNVDADGSGALDAPEIRVVMRRLGTTIGKREALHFVSLLDRDGDGTVSWSEFAHALTDDDFKATLPLAFAKFDISKLASLPSMLDATKTISPEEHNIIVAQMAKLERFGVNFLQKRQKQKMLKSTFSDKHTSRQIISHKMERDDECDDDEDVALKSHFLSDKELSWLRWRCNRAIMVAALAGIVCAVLPGLSEPVIEEKLEDDLSTTVLMMLNLTIGLVASIIEVIMVYRVTFKTALEITQATGLVLYPVDKQRAFAASSLVKTALELGNPTTIASGVNPLRESSKFTMLLAALLYKAKRGLSTFLLKLFVKKVLPRYVAKEFLNLIAAPVNATWNAMTMRKVMGAAKLVAMGPSAVCEIAGGLLRSREHVSPHVALQLLRVIGTLIVVKKQVHPNLQILQNIVLEFVSDKVPEHVSGLTVSDHQKRLDEVTDDDAADQQSAGDPRTAKPPESKSKGGLVKDFFVGGIKRAKRQAELQFGSGDIKPVTAQEKRDVLDRAFWAVFQIDNRSVLNAGMKSLEYDERCFVVSFVILGIVICGQVRRLLG